uniref:Adhesion G protein-coupled receptor F5-like n=1 Tax=Lepisosteus oculatus TaxID=7918 RepID=W5NIB4_LEPOC
IWVVAFFFHSLTKKCSCTRGSSLAYYAELIMEGEAASNITAFLASLSDGFPINLTDISIISLNVTTECDINGETANCSCNNNFIWSGSVCDTNPECCNNDYCIVAAQNSTPIFTVSVIVSGQMTLNKTYISDLQNKTSYIYINMSASISALLKEAYSTLSGFDTLKIIGFRQGSIIVDFEVYFNAPLTTEQLANKTENLQNTLNATFILQTTGIVTINAPQSRVKYMSQQNLNCAISENMNQASWSLKKENKDLIDVVDGTESKITFGENCLSLSLSNVTEFWKGTYFCNFTKGNIINTASANLDVALLPAAIETEVEPQNPDCSLSGGVSIKVRCNIQNSSENYTVLFYDLHGVILKNNQKTSEDIITYETEINDVCQNNTKLDKNVTCSFQNNLFQSKNLTIIIPVMYDGTQNCSADEGWPKTKANFISTLQCTGDKKGNRQRKCTAPNIWKEEVKNCVNPALSNMLQIALNLLKGQGAIANIAETLFDRLKNTTANTTSIDSYADLKTSVDILNTIYKVSNNTNSTFEEHLLFNMLTSASNMLNENLTNSWNQTEKVYEPELVSAVYLNSVEKLIENTKLQNTSLNINSSNIEFKGCVVKENPNCIKNLSLFNNMVSMNGIEDGVLKTMVFKTIGKLLPNNISDTDVVSSVQSITLINSTNNNGNIRMIFSMSKERALNYEIKCVFWDFSTNKWSEAGCQWIKKDSTNFSTCDCNHLTSFSVLMSKFPISLPFGDELTYVGMGVSICSLLLCIVIEFLVWNTVVKSNISHFRHTALVNISLNLLIADCSFLGSSFPEKLSPTLCLGLTIVKHFCYLAMFFWMLCLSTMLLHQLVFIFHQMRKKVYLSFSFIVGYICPSIIVAATYVYFGSAYHNPETCWLIYSQALHGSIFSFVFPVLTIVIINFFAMAVVITKLLRPSVSEGTKMDEKETLKSILKAVIFLTPVFGVTWILGFLIFTLDLNDGLYVKLIHYAFIILNSFQGLFILITGCLTEKKVREALLKYVNSVYAQPSKTESSSKAQSSFVKK